MKNILYKKISGLAFATVLLLMIPLLAMQITNEVTWDLIDFIFAGTFLFGTGLTYILATRNADNIVYRVAVGVALAAALFLVWSNLAVGIIGSEDNAANLMYFGVLAVGIIGTIIARFHPQGMARALFAMALTQGLVTIIALLGGYYQSPPSSVIEILGVNGFFITLFVVSALLFNYAAKRGPERNPV